MFQKHRLMIVYETGINECFKNKESIKPLKQYKNTFIETMYSHITNNIFTNYIICIIPSKS